MAQGRVKIGVDIVKGNTSGIAEIKTQLQQLQGLTEKDLININSSKATEELNKIKNSAKAVEDALEKSFNIKLNTNNISVFNKELSKSGYSLKDLAKEWKNAGVAGQQTLNSLTASLMTSNRHLKESSALLDKMANTLSNTIRWSIASSAINSVTGAVQKAYSFTKRLDESLNDIRIVTGKSAEEMNKFAVSATKAASKLGAITTDYTKASLIYYQQGLSDQEVAARSETTVKVANITGQSAEQVSEQLTAVWNGYKVNANEAELYIDKLANVAAKTATDLEELSTGMSKVASAANIMGVDIDQLNAQLATIVSVTREAPESIGTALKTVYARMSDIQAGLDTETTLGEYTSQMAEMGINVLDASGNLRDMGDVIEEIGGKWDSLTRTQQTSLAQTIAGTRQYSRMMSLFDNWSMYEKSLLDSQNAAGTIAQQNEVFLDSLEARFNELTTEAEKLYQTLFNADDLKPLVSILTSLVATVNTLVEGLGGGKGLLGMISSIGLTVFGDKLASGMAKATRNAKNFVVSLNDAKVMQQMINEMQNENPNLDTTAVEEIVKLKKEQLKVEKFLTEEQREQAAAIINSKTENENKKAALIERQNKAKKVKTSLTADGSNLQDRFDDIKLNNQIISQATTDWQSVNQSSERIADLKIRLAAVEKKYSQALAEQAENENQETINKTKFLRDQIQKRQKEIAALESEQYNQSQNFFNEENPNLLLDMQRQAESLKSSSLFTEEDTARLEEINSFLEEIQAKTEKGVKLDDNDIKKISAAFRDLKNYSKEGVEGLQQTVDTLENGEKEMQEYEAAIKRAEQANKAFVESFNAERIFSSLTSLTSATMSLGVAIEQAGSIGSIWEDADLSTGEKLLQTIIAFSSAAGMALNSFSQMKNGISTLVDLYGKYREKIDATNAAEQAKMATEEASAAQNLKSAVTSKVKEEATEEEQEETNKDSLANLGNVVTENLVQKENAESGQSSLQKEGDTSVETQATNADTAANIANKISEQGGKGGSTPTPKPTEKIPKGGKGGLKLFGKGGGGASAAAGAVAGAAIAIAGTLLILDHFDNMEKRAFEEAQAQAEQAQENFNKVSESYNNFISSMDGLRDMEDSMSTLTKGTEEWTKALQETNAEVSRLIKEYPELAQYVTVGENGNMTITKEGQEKLEQTKKDQMAAAQSSSILADRKARAAELDMLRDEWAETATYGSETGEFWAQAGSVLAAGAVGAGVGAAAGAGIGSIPGAIIGGVAGIITGAVGIAAQEAAEEANKQAIMESDDFQKMAAAYSTKGDAMFANIDAFEDALKEVGGELNDTTRALFENKEATIALTKAYNESKAQDYAEWLQLGASILGEDASTGAKILAGKKAAETTADEETLKAKKEEIKQEREKNGSWDEEDKKTAEVFAKQFGLEYDAIETSQWNDNVVFKKDGQEIATYKMDELYTKMAEQALLDEIAKDEVNFEKISSSLSSKFNNSEAIANKIPEIIKGNADFTSLTLGDMSKLTTNALSREDIAEYAEAAGISADELINNYRNSVKIKDNALAEATAGLRDDIEKSFKAGISDLDLSNLTLDTYKKFANSYEDIVIASGDEMVTDYMDILEAAGTKSDDLINSLMNTDWSTVQNPEEHLQSILNTLQISLGPEMEGTLENIVRMLSGKVKDLKTMQSEYAELQTLMEKATAGASWSAEEYRKLTKAQQKYFTIMADGTALLTGDAYALKKALSDTAFDQAKDNLNVAQGNVHLLEEELKNLKDEQEKAAKEEEIKLATQKAQEAAMQYALTASSEAELSAIVNDETIDEEIRDYLKDNYDSILESVNISGFANSLGKTVEEAAALYDAFDGDVEAARKHSIALEQSASVVEAQVKVVEDLEESLNLLSDSAKIAALETLQSERRKLNSDQQTEYENKTNDNKFKFNDIVDQFDDWGTSDIKSLLTNPDEWNNYKNNTFLSNSNQYSKEQKDALWALDKIVKDQQALAEEREKQRQEHNLAILKDELDQFNILISLEIDKNETQRRFNEFQKNFLNEQDFTAFVNLDISNFDSALSDYNTYLNALSELETYERVSTQDEVNEKVESGIKAITDAEYEAKKQELLNSLMESGEALLESRNAMEETYLNYQDAVNESYEEYLSLIESANNLLEHQVTLTELIYGDQAFKYMNKYHTKQVANAKLMFDANKERYLQDKKDYEDLVKAGVKEDDEKFIAAKERYLASGEAYFASITDYATKASEQYANNMEILVDNFNNQMLSDESWKDWEWMKKSSEVFVNDIEIAFEKSNIRRAYEKAINSSSSLKAQQALNKALDEEMKKLREKDKLTKYDLERATKRLDVELALLALENARESKTQMRLMRGQDGSYGFQYVANQEGIAKAQENLEKTQKAQSDADMAGLRDAISYAQKLQEEYTSNYMEIMNNGELSEKERIAKIAELNERYLPEFEAVGEDVVRKRENAIASAEELAKTLGIEGGAKAILPELFNPIIDEVSKWATGDAEVAMNDLAKQGAAEREKYDNILNVAKSAFDNAKTGADAFYNSIMNQENGMLKAQSDAISKFESMSGAMTGVITTLGLFDLAISMMKDEIAGIAEGNGAEAFKKGFDVTPTKEGAIQITPKPAAMDTGGYTGEWGPEGKFLLAHEKELILNKQDTANILRAVDIVRALGDSMMTTVAGLGAGQFASAAAWELAKDFIIEQTVNINAEFPNVQDRSEIEAAFEDLINLATQHAYEDVRGR